MAFQDILVTTPVDHVGTITLNRPEQMNTFSTRMAQELNQALLDLDADPGVRVILVKGTGKAFCAGIDVTELAGKTPLEYQAWIETMEQPLITISRLNKPVIAQVHGVAVANGMGLLAAADLVMAADTLRMGLTAIKAPEALSLGLVNLVVPGEELEASALAWAAELAKKSPIAVRIAKTAFYRSEDMHYEARFAYMNEAFARLCTTQDAKEGVSAFFDKRPPQWQEK